MNRPGHRGAQDTHDHQHLQRHAHLHHPLDATTWRPALPEGAATYALCAAPTRPGVQMRDRSRHTTQCLRACCSGFSSNASASSAARAAGRSTFAANIRVICTVNVCSSAAANEITGLSSRRSLDVAPRPRAGLYQAATRGSRHPAAVVSERKRFTCVLTYAAASFKASARRKR
jgi:hypothetical protein